jgi:predicted lipoprotein with Yx(FWY)xxD motif
MARRGSIFLAPALALRMIAVAIAGCGGSSSNNASASPSTTTKQSSSQAGAATVNIRSTSLGKILVDSQGRTLYLFEKDTGTKSSCSGACASAWPPFTTSGKPKAGSGATASLVGTTTRSDGTDEVTYNGHPLYYYAGDQKAGDMNGQDLTQFGAGWYVVSPAGKKIEGTMAQASTGGSSRAY